MYTYGIELEVSNLAISTAQYALNQAGLNWSAKADGTRDVSAEAVSPILTAERLNEARTASRALLAQGATVNKQTGYHVHIGADALGIDGVARLVWNWNWTHATIGALVAKSRLNNHFCKAVDVRNLENWCESVRNGRIRNAENGRYWSLNLNSYEVHSTVEVRLHHGTLNGSKIKAWAEFVGAIAKFSADGGLLTHDKWNRDSEKNENIKVLLDTLVEQANLNQDTAGYLKVRAEELSAR
jgi:hypothetical protein